MKKGCVHFVGFKGDEYLRAVAVFGEPDFIHRFNDKRCVSMIVKEEGDIAIFANGSETNFHSVYSFDDSECM